MNKWPLSALITIIALFATAIGSFAVTKYQANDTAKKVEKICDQRETEKSEIMSMLAEMKVSMERANGKTELLIQDVKFLRSDVAKLSNK